MGMLWTTFSPAFSLPELISDTSTKRNYAEYFASFQLPLQNGEKHEQCICGERSASLCLFSYDPWTDKLRSKVSEQSISDARHPFCASKVRVVAELG